MGISTKSSMQEAPWGCKELCTYKFIIHGAGQIR